MSIAITLVCNKGGVGRSTTAQNVGWSLAKQNYNVLVVDLDSQANTSITLCKNYEELVITGKKSITEMLKLDRGTKEKYHFIIYDTPPRKTDKFIHNALIISNYYWYIVSSENRWALDAKPIMDKTINDVCDSMGAKIYPIPALLTLYRRRNALSTLVMEQCKKIFEQGIMKATIRDTTEMRKSSAMYKTIYEYNHRAEVAKDYTTATKELIVTLRANQQKLKL